jgi:hypothetical protein
MSCNCKMLFRKGVNASRPHQTILHRPPKIPTMIDFVEVEQSVLRDFRDQPLYTVLDRDGLDGKMLQIFTSEEKAKEYCSGLDVNNLPQKSASQKVSSTFRESAIPPRGGYVDLYEHIDWGGCSWRILESQTLQGSRANDFTQLWACGFLWWGWVNANDKVSGVDSVISGNSSLVLCEDMNLGGSWLIIPGNAWVPNLVPYGWNDRASSLFWLYS